MSRCPKFRSAVFGLVGGVSAGFIRRTGVDDLTDESGLRGVVLLLSFFILSVLAGDKCEVRTPLSDAIIRRRDIITIDCGVLG
jgi:hypothetical protein